MAGRTTTCVGLELQKINNADENENENENRKAVKRGKRKEKRKKGNVFENIDEQKRSSSSNSYRTSSSISVPKNAKNSSENGKEKKHGNRNKNEIEKEKEKKKKNKIKNKYENENRNKELLDNIENTENTENKNDEKDVMCLGAKTKDVKEICVEIPNKIPGILGGINSFEDSTHVSTPKNYNACSTVLKKLVHSTENNCKKFHKNFTVLSDRQTVLKRKEIKTDNDLIKLSVIEGMLSEEIPEINKYNRSFFKPLDKKELNDIKSSKINQGTSNRDECQISGEESIKEKFNHLELEPQEKVIEEHRKIISDKKDMYGTEECIYFYKEQPSVSESKEKTSYEETKQCNIAPECLNTATDIKHIKDAINLTYKKYKHNRIPRRRLAKILRSFNYVDHKTPKDDKSCQTNLNISFHERELDIQLSVITNLHNIVFKEREKIKELKDLMQYTTSEIEKENNKLYEELSLYKTKYNRLKSQISNIGYGSILNMQEKQDIEKSEHNDCFKSWEEDSSDNLTKGKYISGSTCEDDYVIVNSIRHGSLKKEKDVKVDNRNMSSCALLKFIDF